jgi:hypothetical protein
MFSDEFLKDTTDLAKIESGADEVWVPQCQLHGHRLCSGPYSRKGVKLARAGSRRPLSRIPACRARST